MKLFGKNRKGRPMCSTKERKRTAPTKAERRLQARIESFNAFMRRNIHKPMGPESDGYHRPGSRKTT